MKNRDRHLEKIEEIANIDKTNQLEVYHYSSYKKQVRDGASMRVTSLRRGHGS